MTIVNDHRTGPAPRGPALLRTLVVGAGVAGRALARDLAATPEFGLLPIGFVDDDLSEQPLTDLPLLGHASTTSTAVALSEDVDVVVLAIPRLDPDTSSGRWRRPRRGRRRQRALPPVVRRRAGACGRRQRHAVAGRRPAASAVTRCTWSATRRPPMIKDRVVLVTGAGGSIGSELCRQVFGFGPSRLIMLDHDESNLHRLQLELWGEALLDSDDCVVADIRDRERLDQVFADVRPDIVFHAAAHKHLPLLERHPCEAVKSNVAGTENVLWAALEHEAERFILISTDKAADPTSVLGATKRLAELLVQQERGRQHPRRRGPVRQRARKPRLPAHRARRADRNRGQPMTVTHPDMTRFFMTIEEAAGLVDRGGPDGRARARSSSWTWGSRSASSTSSQSFAELMHRPDVEIRFTGMREGEKLNETLFSRARGPTADRAPADLPGRRVGRHAAVPPEAEHALPRGRAQQPGPGPGVPAGAAAGLPAPGADHTGSRRAVPGRLLMTSHTRVAVVITRFTAGAGEVALNGAAALDPRSHEVTVFYGAGDRMVQRATAAGIRAVEAGAPGGRDLARTGRARGP